MPFIRICWGIWVECSNLATYTTWRLWSLLGNLDIFQCRKFYILKLWRKVLLKNSKKEYVLLKRVNLFFQKHFPLFYSFQFHKTFLSFVCFFSPCISLFVVFFFTLTTYFVSFFVIFHILMTSIVRSRLAA